jgi:hypothetical protein
MKKEIEHNVLCILREIVNFPEITLQPIKLNLTNALKELASGKKISLEKGEKKGGSRSPSSSPRPAVSQDDIALQESS